jgi:hypothetical protein
MLGQSTEAAEIELAHRLLLAERRRRFRWQADVSGPGSAGVAELIASPLSHGKTLRHKGDSYA